MNKKERPIANEDELLSCWMSLVLKYLAYAKQHPGWLRSDTPRDVEPFITFVSVYKESQTGTVSLTELPHLPPPDPSRFAGLMKILRDVAAKRKDKLSLKKRKSKEEEKENKFSQRLSL